MRWLVVLVCLVGLSAEAGRVRVRSYVRRSTGKYVAPSYRTKANRTRLDNYSTRGNFNPYSGKRGTKSAWR